MAGVGPVVERVVVGTLSGVEPKTNGWMQFSLTEEGKQYPLKVSTKQPETIQQAMALLGQRVKIKVGEQVTDRINPNSQKPYINRYLNQIAVAGPQEVSSGDPLTADGGTPAQTTSAQGGATGSAQQTTAAQPNAAAYADYARELSPVATLRIMRMGASERATEMLAAGMLPQEQQTMEGLVSVAEAWVAYYTYGAARFGVPAFDAGVAHQQPQQAAVPAETSQHETPPHTDDDIPFMPTIDGLGN